MSETSETLKLAWTAVEEAGLPETVKVTAFQEAVRLLTTSASATGSPRPGFATRDDGSSTGRASERSQSETSEQSDLGLLGISEPDLVKKVSAGTGAGLQQLEQLIHIDGDALRISLAGIRLGRNNADRTRAIAAILTVVRSFGLNEDETPLELVRLEAQRLKCYDSANFSSQLKALQGYLIKGSGNSRRIQAKGPGLKEFPDLVQHLVGEA